MGSEEPLAEPNQPGDGPPRAGGDTLDEGDQAPDNVGESIGRRGEAQADKGARRRAGRSMTPKMTPVAQPADPPLVTRPASTRTTTTES